VNPAFIVRGSKNQIKDLQRLLRCDEINGFMDAETVARLRGFQMVNGIEPTGAVDPETAKKIGWINA
jgi:peptidoglycan hydrolase-like protein with peptidoglycan-binding domain